MLAQASSGDKNRALASCARLPTLPLQVAAWLCEDGLSASPKTGVLFMERGGGLAWVSRLGVVMPHLRTEDGLRSLARWLGPDRGRVIIGPADATRALWRHIERRGARARIIRDQIAYVTTRERFRGHEASQEIALRPAGQADLDIVVDASAAMALEESKDDPARRNPGLFRSRISDRIRLERDFILVEEGRLVFKITVAACCPLGGYLEGVYTIPSARGRGLGRAGTAWATRWILERAPTATLLVNTDNHAARRMYENLGFVRAYDSQTILVR